MVAGLLDGTAFRIAVGLGFLAMAAWAMIPDKLDDSSDGGNRRFGAFLTTLVAFFIVEIGDKTQIATIGLGARYQRSEEHTSELQSLMRISYAVFCLKKKR